MDTNIDPMPAVAVDCSPLRRYAVWGLASPTGSTDRGIRGAKRDADPGQACLEALAAQYGPVIVDEHYADGERLCAPRNAEDRRRLAQATRIAARLVATLPSPSRFAPDLVEQLRTDREVAGPALMFHQPAIVFTDGSQIHGTAAAGWSWWASPTCWAAGIIDTTSPTTAEVAAIVRAVETVPADVPLTLHTDCEVVIGMLRDRQYPRNVTDDDRTWWDRGFTAIAGRTIQFAWVRGHNQNRGNCEAHAHAKAAARSHAN